MDVSNRLALPYLAAAQSQKHVTHNEALRMLDALVQIGVLDAGVNAPPATPAEGARYLVGDAPTGDFSGHAGHVAAYDDAAWRFYAPRAGWICRVSSNNVLLVHDGTAWKDIATFVRSLAGLQSLSIGTGVDAGNPFSAKLNDALFAARGSGEGGNGSLRLKLNKENAAATASFLFQSGWSGRAEAGLVGDENFRIKVSANGTSWRDSLVVDRSSGAVSFPSGVVDLGGAGLSALRNHVVNGDFQLAQRGTGPFAWATAATYGFDRWLTLATGGTPAGLVSRTNFPPGQTDCPGASFYLTLAVTAATTAAPEFQTRLEDVGRLAGRTVTLSFRYRTTSAAFFSDFSQGFGTGGSAAVAGLGSAVLPASPTWAKRSVSLALPSIAAKTVGSGSYTMLRFGLPAGQVGSLDLADVQVEEGPVATAFARRPIPIELLFARRFFRRYAVAQNVTDLAAEMRTTPVQSGAGPFDYVAEL